ncbi:hypothetical protein G8770_03730 [Aestuariicella hydrocarbonica]|uniref:Uncharacterized protein n=1 Tax=Pseudomaricurvus hydrocarbonicus TaxID=1470433 RepID=A0A9E5MGH0_9GAMM|nr:hypothetical protein [Aestuariicella hydrocarbonica]NHO64656.1 hypothetical protein [Aestuariicella hydrocarbonica]
MKKTQQIKRARKLLTGLIIQWTDNAPLTESADIHSENISHTSPVLRLQCKSIWRDYHDWITNRQTMLWRIDITVVFSYPNGRDQLEQRRVIARAKLWDIAHQCEPVIAEALRHGAHPKETRFTVQCLGDRQATDADFEDYEAA